MRRICPRTSCSAFARASRHIGGNTDTAKHYSTVAYPARRPNPLDGLPSAMPSKSGIYNDRQSAGIITTAERRFPIRIGLGVPPDGVGQHYSDMTAWLDENCGAGGLAMTPYSGRWAGATNRGGAASDPLTFTES